MITQPNPGRAIMVTFNTVLSIFCADATICNYFVDGAVENRLVILDCMEEDKFMGWLECPLLRSQGDEPMCWKGEWALCVYFEELKANILKLQDLRTSEVGTKFERPHEPDWRSFLVCREFVNPLAVWSLHTTLNVATARKKLLDFRCCKFVIVPNSKVCRCKGAFGVGDDFGSAFLLGDRMHGLTCLGGILRNANNMPDLLVHFGFLYNNDMQNPRPVRGGGGTSVTIGEDSLMVGKGKA